MLRVNLLADFAKALRHADAHGDYADDTEQEIREEDVGEIIDRRGRDGIDAADGGDEQQGQGGDAEDDVFGLHFAAFLEKERSGERDQDIGGDEPEGAHGASVVELVEHLDVEDFAAEGNHDEHDDSHDPEGNVRGFVFVVGAAGAGVENAVPAHGDHDAGASVHAGKRQGEETAHGTQRELDGEEGDVAEISHDIEGRVDLVQRG